MHPNLILYNNNSFQITPILYRNKTINVDFVNGKENHSFIFQYR